MMAAAQQAHGRPGNLLLVACTAAWLAACSAPPKQPDTAAAPATEAPASTTPPLPLPPPAEGIVAGRSQRLLVYLPKAGDSYASLAAHFLGSASKAWQIAEANRGNAQPVAGRPLVVPLAARNPLGITVDGVQAVPILCYHRIGGDASKMSVSAANFDSQMDWLATNGYQVVRLSDLAEFLAGRKALPRKSVVITFDDGHESVYRHAFPALKQRGYPATLFVYTDFLGARDALAWPQMGEMQRSGLFDVQAHSKSHRNLTERSGHDSEASYRQQLTLELRQPRLLIERQLNTSGAKVRHFAYPYGDANDAVFDAMRRQGYELGLTVLPGNNAFFAPPLLLKRTMVYGDHSLDDFKARLNGRQWPPWP